MKDKDVIKRHSKQRDCILNVLKQTKSHPSAYEVHEAVSADFPNMSLGTVYRNLKQLEQSGKIRRLVTASGIEHYDYDTSEHHHFICRGCGRVFDIETIGEILPKGDYYACHTEVQFYGLCGSCKAKQDENRC